MREHTSTPGRATLSGWPGGLDPPHSLFGEADFKVAACCPGEFIEVHTGRIHALIRCFVVHSGTQKSTGAGVKNGVNPPSLNPTEALVIS
jgi:hypothetical protein